jgi:hypothetical protein
MDRWTQEFMAKHGLSITFTKTKLTGRDKEGNASADQIYWAGRTKSLDHLDPTKHIKYLGILISFDLDWTPQINKMNGYIMNITARLTSKSITLLQGSMLLKTVLPGLMELD